jgi:hypothetical protein
VQDLSITLTTFKSTNEVKLVMNKTKDSMIENKNNIDINIWHLYSHVDVKMDSNEAEYYNDLETLNDNENVLNDKMNGDLFLKTATNVDSTIDSVMGAVFKDRFKKFLKKSKINNRPPKYPKIVFHCRAARRPEYYYWVTQKHL